MIGMAGQICLLIALGFSIIQSGAPLVGYWRNNPYLLAAARPSAWAQLIFICIAYGLLTIAFAKSDFSIAYVAANSHPSLPLPYRLTASWGAHEGSILFWILILNIWTIVFTVLQKQNKSLPLTLAILGIISFSFLCFVLLTSNPFQAAIAPQAGQDLNPLLQDPGFVSHPPMLYVGYVGFSVAFAITLAALIRGQLDHNWALITRRFAVAAWCFLTLGITLGSWWAYRVLGWGGFWFWDPVENASLLPWFTGVALIHVLLLAEKREMAKAWAALLAMIGFALSLLGTFLVRSGVLISAHTFANDPARGVFLLVLLAVLITIALAIYVMRLPKIPVSNAAFSWLSRESGLLANSVLLFIAMLTVLVGTLYPLILDAFQLGTISVGAPYFNKVMLPLVLIAMILMGFGPLCRWQDQPLKNLWLQTWKPLSLSTLAACVFLWVFTQQIDVIAIISLSLSLWIIINMLGTLRLQLGMSLAHLGFAVFIIGIILSSILNQEREVRIRAGEATNIGPYQFFFIDMQNSDGSNYRGIRATFEVLKNKRHIANLYPEKRLYTVRNMVMTKVDIHPGIFRDLYLALGDPLENDYWSVRLYYKPFVRFIWFGGMIMMLGGLIAIVQRRKNPSVIAEYTKVERNRAA